MSKIAIVGVEGSGKSTLMAVLGEKFVKRWTKKNVKGLKRNYETASIVCRD